MLLGLQAMTALMSPGPGKSAITMPTRPCSSPPGASRGYRSWQNVGAFVHMDLPAQTVGGGRLFEVGR
jgi:hypothetical protein